MDFFFFKKLIDKRLFYRRELRIRLFFFYTCQKILQHFSVGQQVHVLPADAGLERGDDCVAGAQNGVVDQLLIGRKFATDGIRTGDVGAEAVVVGAHVEQDNVFLPENKVE